MTHWNHRVIAFETNGEKWWSVHEVYYDENGEPWGYAEGEAGLMWFDGESPEDQLMRLRKALDAPVLTDADFPKNPAG